jgi:FtsH-binding integral membrane protein
MNTNPDKYSSATTASSVANEALDPAVANFVMIYNLFLSLLQLFGIMSDD